MEPIQFKTVINTLPHLVGTRYMEIPPNIVAALGGKYSLRLICTVNGSLSFQGGLVSLGNGYAYISINQKRMKQLGVEVGDTIDLKLEKDESEYGVPVPEELVVLFEQDDEGYERFKGLAKGMQRYILNYVSTVKNQQKRIDRAVMLIGNLKKCKVGKETFRDILGIVK